jgi:hypothetical protein
MNPDWQSFLVAQGVLSKHAHSAIGAACLCDLSAYGLIRVSGADAGTFLQGQLTNDVSALDAGHSQLNGWLTAKGRLLAVLRVFRRDTDWLLRLPQILVEPIVKRLRLFVLRAQVQIEDAATDLAGFALCGEDSPPLLAEVLGFKPCLQDEGSLIECDGVSILRAPGESPRFELYAPPATLAALWKQLGESAQPANDASWRLLELRAGLPEIYPETQDRLVPQMANLQLVGGVSFTKGCYPGQEIVARMHYLGALKRRMYRVHMDCAKPPTPGTPLYATDAPEQDAGLVLYATLNPEGGCEALVSAPMSLMESAALQLGDINGPSLQRLPLPYSF